jgi:hypothetical protein
MVNYKKFRSLPVFKLVSVQICLKAQSKDWFKLENWRILRKLKWYIVIAIIVVMLISVFAFLPEKSVPPSNLISEKNDDSSSSQEELIPEPQEPTEPSIIDTLTDFAKPILEIFQKTPGIKDAPTINGTVWMKVAENAWAIYIVPILLIGI